MTTRGMNEPRLAVVGDLIHEAIPNHGNAEKLEAMRLRVLELNERFPLP